LIRVRLAELDEARTNLDIDAMVYLIRTHLSRDLGGMGNMDLYRHSYIGTKTLVERYVNSAIQTIELLVDRSTYEGQVEPKDLLEDMLYARQSFGRSALLLSGGATFGMSHIGVLKTLYEEKLLPRIISGASAGSIVCAVLCTRTDEEIPALIESFPTGDLGVFQGKNESWPHHLRNLLTKGNWSDIGNLKRVMRGWIGDITFQEAYNRTRRVCNICVSSASIFELPRLLNYITSPNVMMWSAVTASCSVPLIFQGSPLMMKDPVTGDHVPWNLTPHEYIDGSVDNDLPMTRLADLFNINHFIVSQVNPHIVPFLDKDDQLYPAATPGKLRQARQKQNRTNWVSSAAALALDEGLHRMQALADMGLLPNLLTKLRSILMQEYLGDITIFPAISIRDAHLVLSNPTSDFMMRNCLLGERATWPKLSRIRDRLAIEVALDQAVHDLRARTVFSKSQEDIRRSVHAQTYWMSGYSMGPATWVTQPSSSGPVTPEEYPIWRRSGSASTMQHVAARHKKSFQDAEDDSEEESVLEIRPSTKTTRHNRSAVVKPRLKRSSKSHDHMRGRQPTEDYVLGELKLPSYGNLTPLTPGLSDNLEGAIDTATEEASRDPLVPLSPRGTEIMVGSVPEAGEASQPSDGGQQSDLSPYQEEIGHRADSTRKGASLSKDASSSKEGDLTVLEGDFTTKEPSEPGDFSS
jgi:TAG lipase/steryl ester hydrolase/phospholipase A2/LPA acyltransferase